MRSNVIRGTFLALILVFLSAAGAGQALAVGTPAGTVISNQATVDQRKPPAVA